MKRAIRVLLTDFPAAFSPEDFYLLRLLAEDFSVAFDRLNPELLIFSDYGVEHLDYSCHKIYYSHENTVTNAGLCDYSFCFNGRGKNHQYFPNFVENEFFQEIRLNTLGTQLKELRHTPKTRFCNFVYSNGKAKERVRFCQSLMAYKHVDCPGKVLNNQPPFDSNAHFYCAGDAARQKTQFLKHYKFTIAFENESAPNYTTEKIFHAFVAGSIPIYWGNPNVARLFNPQSFINCHHFASFSEVIELVKEADQNDKLFGAYQQAPAILADSPLASITTESLRARLKQIIASLGTRQPVSQGRLFPVRRWSCFVGTKLRNRAIYTGQRIQELATGTSSRIAWRARLTKGGAES